MKQGDRLKLTIIDYGNNGEGIAKQDGRVIFLPFAMKGEIVNARIKHVKKDYAFAEIIDLVEPSPYRVKPPCNRFMRCGGCDIMHIEYKEQLRLKQGALYNTLRKNFKEAFTIDSCVESAEVFGYRNKIMLPFGIVNGRTVVGFYSEGTHKVVPITKCFLHGDWAEKLIEALIIYAERNNISVYDETTEQGVLRHAAARYLNGKLSLAIVINAGELPNADSLIKLLDERFTDYCLYYSPNRAHNNVIMGDSAVLLKGEPLKAEINGIRYELNPLSFLQVNDSIRDAIYQRIIEKVIESGSSAVIDAYAGVGLLGAMLARLGLPVYNIEIVKEAVIDADKLAEANGLTHLITNINGDAEVELPKLFDYFNNTYPRITVILDPPRKGCSREIIDALNSLYLSKEPDNSLNGDYQHNAPIVDIIYISCNPATLSRDLALLAPSYRPTSITPYDMFPHTKHLETLVCLKIGNKLFT